METLERRDALKEVLAGHRGQCDGYKDASGLGFERQPFTWLSSGSPGEDSEHVAGSLQAFKRSREAVWFEAWELGSDGWQLLLSGKVRVLYAEVDDRLGKVRAILQWSATVQSRAPSRGYQSLAV